MQAAEVAQVIAEYLDRRDDFAEAKLTRETSEQGDILLTTQGGEQLVVVVRGVHPSERDEDDPAND